MAHAESPIASRSLGPLVTQQRPRPVGSPASAPVGTSDSFYQSHWEAQAARDRDMPYSDSSSGQSSGWWPRRSLFASLPKRSWLNYDIESSRVGRVLSLSDMVLTLLQCTLFIYATTVTDVDGHPLPLPLFCLYAEIGLALGLLTVTGLREVSWSRWWFPKYLIALLCDTIPPLVASMLALTSPGQRYTYLSAGALVLLYPVRFYRVSLSAERALAPGRAQIVVVPSFEREVILLAVAILSTIMTLAAATHVIFHWQGYLAPGEEFTFFDAFFFSATCITSGPDEGVVPNSWITRVMILLTLTIAAVFLPSRINNLTGLLDQRSSDSQYENSDVPHSSLIVVTGALYSHVVKTYLWEFFNRDHGNAIKEISVLLVSDMDVSSDLRDLLRDPVFARNVRYVRGDPTSSSLYRTLQLESAAAIYVLNDVLGPTTPYQKDARVIRITLAINSYLNQRNPSRAPRMYAQTLSPDSQYYLRGWRRCTPQIMCIDEFRMGLLAQNCTTPGFSTLLYLLSRSVNHEVVRYVKRCVARTVPDSPLEWMHMYLDGVQQEIYQVVLPPGCHGRPYSAVMTSLYTGLGVVLIGLVPHTEASAVNRPDPRAQVEGPSSQVYLAPFQRKIQKGDVGFVLAPSQHVAHKVETGEGWDPAGPSMAVLAAIDLMTPRLSTRVHFTPGHHPEGPSETAPLLIDHDPPTDPAGGDPAAVPFDPAQLRFNPIHRTESADSNPSSATGSLGQESDPRDGPPVVISRQHRKLRRSLSLASVAVQRRMEVQPVTRSLNSPTIHHPTCHNLRGHIIITDCSDQFPRNVEYLVESVRTAHANRGLAAPTMVLLTPAEPRLLQRQWFDVRGDVRLVAGTSLSEADLKCVRIGEARAAITLNTITLPTGYDDELSGAIDDLPLMAKMAQRHCGPRSLMTFLETTLAGCSQLAPNEFVPDVENQDMQDMTCQAFLSGSIVLPSLFNSILAMTFFNQHYLDLFKQLLLTYDSPGRQTPSPLLEQLDQRHGSDRWMDNVDTASMVFQEDIPAISLHNADGSPDGTDSGYANDMDVEPDQTAGPTRPDTPDRLLPLNPTGSLPNLATFSVGAGHNDRAGNPVLESAVPGAAFSPSNPDFAVSPHLKPAPLLQRASTTSSHDSSDSDIGGGGTDDRWDDESSAGSDTSSDHCAQVLLVKNVYDLATYGALVGHLAHEYEAVALGLYRKVHGVTSSYRCVMVNPSPESGLHASDQIYVITATDPQRFTIKHWRN
ncbi:hypothetical protein IWQ60_005860 [Tieghemiomyces parasiticus]|uniref:Calcium-activated potassium channel BK alpha subunit domain-containing protein n=1 Tax=Tieghemiomyces parasiticus TaxID=78921 RepID=A0A9W8AB01_9FUNG|nr:hypothetical protein IWQ60_005860 [Tieghemiomyces parasiticus]